MEDLGKLRSCSKVGRSGCHGDMIMYRENMWNALYMYSLLQQLGRQDTARESSINFQKIYC